jgi:hypothetical protein
MRMEGRCRRIRWREKYDDDNGRLRGLEVEVVVVVLMAGCGEIGR